METVSVSAMVSIAPHLYRTDRHLLSGTVTLDAVPVLTAVHVMDRGTLQLYASTCTDPTTGAWAIDNIPEYPEESLLVVVVSPTQTANGGMYDYMSQVTAV